MNILLKDGVKTMCFSTSLQCELTTSCYEKWKFTWNYEKVQRYDQTDVEMT